MGMGENGRCKLTCAQIAVTRLKVMTQIASVARFRATGIRSIKTSVEARVIILLKNWICQLYIILALRAIEIITQREEICKGAYRAMHNVTGGKAVKPFKM